MYVYAIGLQALGIRQLFCLKEQFTQKFKFTENGLTLRLSKI